MLVITAVALAAACGFTGCGGEKPPGKYVSLFPEPGSLSGIEALSDIAEYEDSTLFDFLNGGAELYFDYGIVAVASGEYAIGSDRSIEVSLYDMGSAENAFGIYSNLRYPGADFLEIGAEAMVTAGSLDFWKDRYYCRLVAFDTDSATRAAMVTLAESTAANITGSGDLPDIVRRLPVDGRVGRSEKYFRGQLGLNNIRYVAGENLFMLDARTEGVVAQYRIGERLMTAFIIAYPDADTARRASESYLGFLAERGELSQYGQVTGLMLNDGNHVLVSRRNAYVAGTWDAPSAETGSALVGRVLAALQGYRGEGR